MNQFYYYTIRAQRARLSPLAKSPFARFFIYATALALIVGGTYLLIMHNSLGWLIISLASPILMFAHWAKSELRHVKNGKNNTINDLLSTTCLRLMSPHPSPQSIVSMIPKTRSGRFLLQRLQIPLEQLNLIASTLGRDPAAIFDKALEVRLKTDSEQIGGGVLAIALIECYAESEAYLKRLKLEINDLYQTEIWFNHAYGLVKDAKKPRHTGGIGRDLSFGYTPLLQQYAINISQQRQNQPRTQIPQGNRTDVINQMIDIFSKRGNQNIAIVGPNGSGRTTIVYAFAELLLDADSQIASNLKFRQVFSLDASALIANGGERGKLEKLTTRLIREASSAKNVILCLDNAHLFFEEGTGSVDISNVLLPFLENNTVRIILVMDEHKFLKISAQNSLFANALNKIIIPPTEKPETLKILQDQIPLLEYQQGVTYTYRSLEASYELSQRYIHDIEMPGRAKQLLAASARYAQDGLVTVESVETAIEQTYGVKVQTAQTEDARNKLLNLESLIHQRMIGQSEAVSAVAGALRRAGAGVRNLKRPIGTFLFLGPTGVGKTELAKTLSAVYFNDESSIIRLDLNEFVTAEDVARLIEPGVSNPTSLVAQIAKRPFSVVLLDEIEKAHPQVLTTLLQVLDEGILRDGNNQEISFRDSIIIATSNAGANSIREKISQGINLNDFKESIINELIMTNEFKPEFLNRFDEICLFKPLTEQDLMSILGLIINSVNKNLAAQKISVELDEDTKHILIQRGYDPKMGARPIRRMVQKTIENIVANAVLSGKATPGSVIHISPEDIV